MVSTTIFKMRKFLFLAHWTLVEHFTKKILKNLIL